MPSTWMVRAGASAVHVEEFESHGVVAIGWRELGELAPNMPKSDIVARYEQVFPSQSKATVSNQTGQIARFVNEIKTGDTVITYDQNRRLYLVGEVTSDVSWRPKQIEEMPHVREVEWTRAAPRDVLSVETKNTLGAIQTLFLLNTKAAKEVLTKAVPLDELAEESAAPAPEDTTAGDSAVDFQKELLGKSEEAVGDRIAALDWEQLQELVAGILRAMGYKTTISPRGADRGVDIFASPDGLGLEEPRIFVEVKHRLKSTMGSQEIRSFLGGRSAGDRCLYVSTGGFTKDAKYEADRANVPLKLLNLADLRDLLLEYYEQLDPRARALVPLRKTYVPT